MILSGVTLQTISSRIKPYFDWIRHVVTLAAGALTGLVALQGYYVPRSPQLSIALAVCWIALAATIALGLFALREEHIAPLTAARNIRTMRATYGDAETANFITSKGGDPQPWHYKWAVRLMTLAFVLALSSLCVFAVANLGGERG